ncbi:MAG: DedA family protein [Methylococcales bacterium]|nr:DedA family protein [Methylococcales bacterium]
MNEINALISQYGQWFYLLTFIWAALEGETFLLFAGFAAQRGYLNIEALFLAAWLGSLCGDQLFFWAGRCFGIRILTRSPTLKARIDRVMGWLERYAIVFILSYRFMYGVRNVSSIAIGMSKLRWQTFAFWNAVAAMIWAMAFSGFGYFFGDVIDRLPHEETEIASGVQQTMLAILALFLLLFVLRAIVVYLQKRYWHND